MTEPLIPGGCILLARKVIESEIWEKPPLYLKVWIFLLTTAQHSNYKSLKRGQVSTSIPEIIEGVKWKVGARVERPTKDQVFQVLEFLRGKAMKSKRSPDEDNLKATMITTTKATHSLLVTIDNYNVYQDFKSYESNDEGNDETGAKATRKQRQPSNINKNVKNEKNVKDKKTSSRQSKSYAEDDSYYLMAVYFYEKLMSYVEKIGKAHLIRNSNMQKWADDFRKIIEIDERPKQEVGEVINWALADSFWQQNILSPDKLRKKYTELCVKTSAAGAKKPTPLDANEKHFEKNKEQVRKLKEAMEREGIGDQNAIHKDQQFL